MPANANLITLCRGGNVRPETEGFLSKPASQAPSLPRSSAAHLVPTSDHLHMPQCKAPIVEDGRFLGNCTTILENRKHSVFAKHHQECVDRTDEYKRVNEQMEGLHAVFAGRVWDVEGCEQLEELNATIRIVERYIGRLDAAIRGREENHERFFETGESRQTFCGTCGARPTMCSGPVPSR